MIENKPPQWNLCRFVKTLSYFRVIPFVGQIDWLQQLLGTKTKHKTMSNNQSNVILVAGATGGVGKRVVQRLREQGYQVRSLVRNANKAKEILGNQVEIVEGDISIPETLTAEVTNNLKAIICCTGTRVQPVEGDTPTREKYYQGLKFYLPEVVDVPEMVEYKGIQNLLQATRNQLISSGIDQEKVVFDFTQPTSDLSAVWGALDDIVMGGVSESGIRLVNNTAIFSGNVSTANSGGFASVRTRNFESPLNLAEYQGIYIRVRGDGKRYKFILRNEDKWDSIAYTYSFDTVYNIWINIPIPFHALIPSFRAKTVKNADKFDPSKIYSLQLMLSKFEYDGELNPKFKPGLFQLEVEAIKAYGSKKLPFDSPSTTPFDYAQGKLRTSAQGTPQFIHISSAGVTRPGRPGINLDQEPPAVRLNDQLGGILTWKLKGEEAIRKSGIPYTIIRPCALTEEPGGQALTFAQGDNIRGKVSRNDIADLCLYILNEPQAVNVTFEVKESQNEGENRNWETQFASLQPDSP